MKIIVSVSTKRIRQQRKRSFYVQAERKGRAAAPSALTVPQGIKNGYFTVRLTEKGGGGVGHRSSKSTFGVNKRISM